MLQVAYISSPDKTVKPKRLTARDKLHNDAIASIAAWRIRAKERAKKMFEPEFELVRQLELKASNLK